MQKIMFNDKYGLTESVLQVRKTMTRRVISKHFPTDGIELIGITGIGAEFRIGGNYEPVFVRLPYKVGEVVAIAQSYKDAGYTKEWVVRNINHNPKANLTDPFEKRYPGWNNKMFVKAEFMPNFIQFTDIRVERLQDISDEDCLKEGIFQWRDMEDCPKNSSEVMKSRYGFYGVWYAYGTPREAFAALIDKVSGRGTWDKNPWVFAYTFERLKEGGEK